MTESVKNKQVLCFGEVLWDLLPSGKRIGGAPLNAAYHLKKLGIPVAVASRVGEDDLGRGILKFAEEKGLPKGRIQTDPVHPTGTAVARVGTNHEVTYQIIEKTAWDFIQPDKGLKDAVRQSHYLVYGSLITRNLISRNTLYKLLESPLIKVLDVNLRAPFYTKGILRKLLMSADIVKMNEAEMQLISEWFHCTGEKKYSMKALARRFSIKTLIVTDGSKGAYLWHQGEIFFEQSYPVKVVDTVGSGDAFLAGFLSDHIRGKTPEKALKKACLLGAFIAGKSGGCPDYTVAGLKRFENPHTT